MKFRRILSGIISVSLAAAYMLAPSGLGSFSATVYASGENIALKSGDIRYTVVDGKAAVTGYDGTDKSVVIPDKLGGAPVTAIEDYAFYNAKIKHVTLPKTLKKIGYMAFCICYWLEDITLPDSVESVSFKAFSGCAGLKEINISSGTGGLEDGAFFMCHNVKKITVGKNSKNYKMKDGVLYSRDGKELIMCPPSLGLTSFRAPEGVEKIGCCAFYRCEKLKELTFPKSLIEISGFALAGCTSLKEVNIPSGVTTIATNAFEGCTKLKKAVIPDSVKSFSNYIFLHCPKVVIYGADNSAAHRYAIDNDIPFKETYSAVSKPAAPTKVKAEMSSSGRAKVSCELPEQAAGCAVYMSESEKGSYKEVSAVKGSFTVSAEIKGLDPKKEYWFKARAYKETDGKKLYGSWSAAVKVQPDIAAQTEKNAPIYAGFVKALNSDPMYISMKMTQTAKFSGSDYPSVTELEYVVASSGDKFYVGIKTGDLDIDAMLIDGKTVYLLEGISKTARYYDVEDDMTGTKENILASLVSGAYLNADKNSFSSGKKTYNGKKYLYESFINEYGETTVLADSGKNVKYIISKTGLSEAVIEVRKMSKSPGSSVFKVPSDYKIVSVDDQINEAYGEGSGI